MGTFVRRLTALTLLWLLATAALTYAASRRVAAGPTTPPAIPAAAPAVQTTLVVPDVRKQAYVFAEGTLGDAGFSWRVEGAVKGYASDTVESQTPAAGTTVIDTGSPTIVLHLAKTSGVKETGDPQASSPIAGTAIKLPGQAAKTAAHKHAVPKVRVPTRTAMGVKPTVKPVLKKPAVKAPAHRWPQNRPPAFAIPGARKEPLDEMPLTDRATMLFHWIEAHPKVTDAEVNYWLYQHAWIVAGADMGWWHGAAAVQTLLEVDRKAEQEWGIGAKSAQVAQAAAAFTAQHSK
jgi:hypothetical protein